jgi:hypothetical protein
MANSTSPSWSKLRLASRSTFAVRATLTRDEMNGNRRFCQFQESVIGATGEVERVERPFPEMIPTGRLLGPTLWQYKARRFADMDEAVRTRAN